MNTATRSIQQELGIAKCDQSLLGNILVGTPISSVGPIETRHYSYIVNFFILIRMLVMED